MAKELLEFIDRAVSGDSDSMEHLIRNVQPRLRAYILRCTLDPDLADDILQETMLQMTKSLKSIKDRATFWPWLYRVASNKIAGHFRKEGRRAMVRFSAMEDHYVDSLLKDEKDVFRDRAGQRELHDLVLKAIEKLNPMQRSVFSLRCFENFSYDQIAESVGCEPTTARVHFFRARRILQSRLKKQGITGSAVVPALVFFGKITACEKTLAASVTASSFNFSSGLSVAQTVITAIKAEFLKGAAAVGTAAAVAVMGHTVWINTHPHPYPQREEVQSVHYTVQGIGLVEENPTVATRPANRSRKADVDDGPYFSKGAYEMWTQFPEGPDGPIFVRMQRWELDPKTHENKGKLCGWLQNDRAFYYYASGENRVYMTNDPIGMLILPTDPPKLSEFLLKHADYQERIKCSYDRKTGLVKTKTDNRVPDVGKYKTEYAYNVLSDADFERFWPGNAGFVDQRDTMHRRGWTSFTVEGMYHGQSVAGYGRIPFNYRQYRDNKPWLHMKVGLDMEIIDTPQGAAVIYADGGRSVFPPETFFSGFGRPWTGIRAYDTTRRDAGKERIPFKSKREDETGTVVVEKMPGRIEYRINMYADLIEKITFYDSDNKVSGELAFRYAQELEDWPDSPDEPVLPDWAALEPVLRPDYGVFALLENVSTSNIQLAGK